MRSLIGVLVVSWMAGFGLVEMAAASSNMPNGTSLVVSGPNTTLGSFASCDHATMRFTLFNKGPGQGVHLIVTSMTYSSCTPAGTTMSVTGLPWTLDVAGTTSGGTVWDFTATGERLLDTSIFSAVPCTYGGHVGASYSNTSMKFTTTGDLAKTGGSTLCPDTAPLMGTYDISPTLTIS